MVTVMPDTLRCEKCGLNWPNLPYLFTLCPQCERKTRSCAGSTMIVIEVGEAKSMKRHHDFERFYAAREDKQQRALEAYKQANCTP